MTINDTPTITVTIDKEFLIDLLAIGVTWHQMDTFGRRHNPPEGALERLEEWVFQQQNILSGGHPDLTDWQQLATKLMLEAQHDRTT